MFFIIFLCKNSEVRKLIKVRVLREAYLSTAARIIAYERPDPDVGTHTSHTGDRLTDSCCVQRFSIRFHENSGTWNSDDVAIFCINHNCSIVIELQIYFSYAYYYHRYNILFAYLSVILSWLNY